MRSQVYKRGLIELRKHVDSGNGAEALFQFAVPLIDAQGSGVPFAQIEAGDISDWADPIVSVIPGSLAPDQFSLLAQFWQPFYATVQAVSAASGVDFLIDAGRLGLQGYPRPFVDASDLTVLCARSSLREAGGARGWAAKLVAGETGEHETGLVLIGDGKPYPAKNMAAALGMELFGRIVWDPKRAAVFSDGEQIPLRKIARTVFGGSIRQLVGMLQEKLERQKEL
jgi:hypothetical protein